MFFMLQLILKMESLNLLSLLKKVSYKTAISWIYLIICISKVARTTDNF